jgi:hypothetical protein
MSRLGLDSIVDSRLGRPRASAGSEPVGGSLHPSPKAIPTEATLGAGAVVDDDHALGDELGRQDAIEVHELLAGRDVTLESSMFLREPGELAASPRALHDTPVALIASAIGVRQSRATGLTALLINGALCCGCGHG